jgi:guanylate kinase
MPNKPHARGNLLIVAAPSGGGKTSLVHALLAEDERLALSVSHTTRAPRPGEQDGKHYHFVSVQDFRQLAGDGAFAEHALVFGHHYGTHAGFMSEQLDRGLDVILEIDWQGARQVRGAFTDCRSVFILPPSLEVLRQRLAQRATDSDEVIHRRMQQARDEISHWAEFDYLVVNDHFDTALADLRAVIRSLRLGRLRQQEENAELLAELLVSG